ncbi:MAG: phage tail protein [Nitrospirota bacterium]
MTTISEARDRDRASPVLLVEVALLGAGPTLRFSDRNVTVEGLLYEDYLEDLSGLGEELRRADSQGLNAFVTLRFRNEPCQGHAHLVEVGEAHPFEGAPVIIKEAYLDEDGEATGAEALFSGVLEEPREIDLMGFTCRVSSLPSHKDRTFGQALVDAAAWPNAYEDLGEVEPVIYGSGVLVPALRVDWGARTTLAAPAGTEDVSLELSDPSRFPSSGAVWIDREKVAYAGTSGSTLTGCTRGADGTGASAHPAGTEVIEHKSEYLSLLASHELHSVGDVYAEVDRRLWRVTSGVEAVLSGGRHLLRCTECLAVDLGASGTGLETRYPPEERTLRRRAANLPVQQRYFNATGGYEPISFAFPQAPAGTLSEVRTRITWDVTVTGTFAGEVTIYTGPDSTHPRVCTIKGDGTVHRHMPGSFEDSETAWVTQKSLYYTATSSVAMGVVVFSVSRAEQEAVLTSAFTGDPAGGERTRAALDIPRQRDSFNSGGYYQAASVSFPSAPAGTLSEIQTSLRYGIEALEAPNAEINFYLGPGSGYPLIATVLPDGTVITFLPEVEASQTAWQTEATIYYTSTSPVASGAVVFTLSGAEQRARSTEEASVVQVSATGGAAATRTVSRLFAVVSGYGDADGSYGGTGSVIERPDHVIRHVLVEQLGFGPAEVDQASFDEAGASYASAVPGGYRFAFRIGEKVKPSELLSRLARECRSTVQLTRGTWRLGFLADAAPGAVKTIGGGELAGEGAAFTFERISVLDLSNHLTALYKRRYAPAGDEGPWEGTATASDPASQATYGTRARTVELAVVRDKATAEDVLAHMLRESGTPFLLVEFPVFYEHFDLDVGDTIEIDNSLYGGRRFFIEEITRKDAFRATVRARQWWG